ncbi:hypothetical protein TrRE_jg8022 [Triparma retinervis]|uniref:Sphingomyelin synthase-like domain-containing protein n=1 Tax=Triparma retinervis TaxID=2557542 RepID=A0A9W7ADG6_9STRA|nr:hypothetical protein TrRE_jg8022 [Triparma retinervis]
MCLEHWKELVFCMLMQVFHSSCTNLIYYLQSVNLSGAQRTPLFDVSFQFLPLLTGWMWNLSDLFIYSLIITTVFFLVSSIFVSWSFTSKPIFATLIVRRFFVTLVLLQQLRALSFLTTFLPGASEQCIYTPTEEMREEGTIGDFLKAPAMEDGNPDGWNPPSGWGQILFRSDSFTGCGDLMFSSHIMVSSLCVLTIFKYFPSLFLRLLTFAMIATMVPFTLASRKHYTIDVLTSLYVTPLLYELLWVKWGDGDGRRNLERRYGIQYGEKGGAYHISVGNRTFEINGDQLPSDYFLAEDASFDDGDIEMANQLGKGKNSSLYKSVPGGVVATIPDSPHTPRSE